MGNVTNISIMEYQGDFTKSAYHLSCFNLKSIVERRENIDEDIHGERILRKIQLNCENESILIIIEKVGNE